MQGEAPRPGNASAGNSCENAAGKTRPQQPCLWKCQTLSLLGVGVLQETAGKRLLYSQPPSIYARAHLQVTGHLLWPSNQGPNPGPVMGGRHGDRAHSLPIDHQRSLRLNRLSHWACPVQAIGSSVQNPAVRGSSEWQTLAAGTYTMPTTAALRMPRLP